MEKQGVAARMERKIPTHSCGIADAALARGSVSQPARPFTGCVDVCAAIVPPIFPFLSAGGFRHDRGAYVAAPRHWSCRLRFASHPHIRCPPSPRLPAWLLRHLWHCLCKLHFSAFRLRLFQKGKALLRSRLLRFDFKGFFCLLRDWWGPDFLDQESNKRPPD
jgi:hypothetical protein